MSTLSPKLRSIFEGGREGGLAPIPLGTLLKCFTMRCSDRERYVALWKETILDQVVMHKFNRIVIDGFKDFYILTHVMEKAET